MPNAKEQLVIESLTDYPQPIAEALWRLQNARERTMRALQDLPQGEIDWQAPGLQNAIGTLLYHIAAIEIDWLYAEVLQREWTPEMATLYCYPVRDDTGRLYVVQGVAFADHLARLEQTRATLLDGFKGMSAEDYRRPRNLPAYDVTPEWVLHHLAQHEAEHRGEILTIRTLYKTAQNS